MRRTQLVAALLVCAVIGFARAGAAQNAPSPTILNVTMDAAGDQITITGNGFGPAPVVTIDGQPVTVLLGATDTQVSVITPSVLLTAPGTYRLTVVDSVRQVGDGFVVASHAGIVAASVGGIASDTPTVATGGATHVAAPPATGLAGIAAPQPLDSVITLTGFEDSGAPYRTSVGYQALSSNNTTGGSFNTASGYQALFSNTTGTQNTASGAQALYDNTTGGNNTASGDAALLFNTTGSGDTATGAVALLSNTTGANNTASGYGALYLNTTGSYNTASGQTALFANTTGQVNTASGVEALYSNTTGSNNTASGTDALYANTTGANNTASGVNALSANTTGNNNTASGQGTLSRNTTGTYNTALGFQSGFNAGTGNYNLFLGANVVGTASDTNAIRIGLPYDGTNGQNQTFIAGIYGTPITGGLPVVIDANGQLGIAAQPVTFTGPPGQSGTAPPATVAQLQQQVADLSARLAWLESLLTGAAAGGGK
jgi:hypothetical protein